MTDRLKLALATIILSAVMAVGLPTSVHAGGDTEVESTSALSGDPVRGLKTWKKGKCAYCHGWAGDGRGHPRSPGAAPSLRVTKLEPENLKEIVRCGLIGTEMPYHDRMAYRDDRCYGMLADEFEPDTMPRKGKTMSESSLENLVAYVFKNVVGKGSATFDDCESYFKVGSRNCMGMKK
jgi:mono/diheme cytochrome c family protein